MNPALPELFSWISLEMELGSHPAAAGVLGSSWKLEQLQAHSSGSPSASRARAGRRGASDLPPCSLYWPQCLMPSTCQGRGGGWFPALCSHGPAGPILGMPWTQELQQDGIACPGPGQGQRTEPAAPTLTWERSSLGSVPAQAAALCYSHPAAHRGWHCDRNSIQLKVPAGRNWSARNILHPGHHLPHSGGKARAQPGTGNSRDGTGSSRDTMLMPGWETGGQSLAARASSRYVPAQRAEGRRRGWVPAARAAPQAEHPGCALLFCTGSDLRRPRGSGP